MDESVAVQRPMFNLVKVPPSTPAIQALPQVQVTRAPCMDSRRAYSGCLNQTAARWLAEYRFHVS
jgi:hypothetical protein